jgi:hypothetical protein
MKERAPQIIRILNALSLRVTMALLPQHLTHQASQIILSLLQNLMRQAGRVAIRLLQHLITQCNRAYEKLMKR